MSEYVVERTQTINAPLERVHELIQDFHEWTAWSPWDDLDPAMQRTYSGAPHGVGARYGWSGNRRAGAGSMEITGSTPEGVDVALAFLKPFRSTSEVRFSLAPAPDGVVVTWRMWGRQTGMLAVVNKVMKMDRLIGPDLEKGLARLKLLAEGTPA